MDIAVQVRQRGTLTLPAQLRERYDIRPGDTFRLVDLDGIFVLTPMTPMVPELAREIERTRIEAGLSMSGKSIIIASTKGNQPLPEPHSDIKVGLNVYKVRS